MNDKQHRDLALNEVESYIVQAPAGSGKTELLTQRYLKLLSVSNNPENVIAMTFTKKAVSELTQRVIDSLISTQHSRPNEQHKQITFDLACAVMERSNQEKWNLIEMPQRLKISTIDGLSNLITNRYSTESQLIPKRIMEQAWERERAYKHAAEQTLLAINDPEYQSIVGSVLLYLDNNVENFYKLIIRMLSKRDQWLSRLYRGETLDPVSLKDSACRIIVGHLKILEQEAEQHLKADFFELLSVNTLATYSKIKSIPAANIDNLNDWRSICSICLTQDRWRKTVNVKNGFPKELKEQKDKFIAILNNLSSNETLRQLLYEVTLLPDVELPQPQAEILHDISQVLKLCVAQLKILFDKEQACDYIEVSLQAEAALDDNSSISDVALFLDYKINHILIDEFQDTSSSQFSLLEKLLKNWQQSSGKSLFLVGDPMQSIYRFRESQVGLFLQVKELGIANIKPKFLQLNTNFRSSKTIVDGNNDIFSKIFPKFENIYKGAINYSFSDANSKTNKDSAIEFYPFGLNQHQNEAIKVAEIINNHITTNPSHEIAVLVRNRSHLKDIVLTLKEQGIDYEALKTTAFKDHIFTRDMISLTRALLHLGDKLAWLSILRAPWCGLLLEDLLVMSSNKEMIIIEQLVDVNILNQLTDDGQLRVAHITGIMNNVISNMGRFSFVELLSFAIDKLIPQNYLKTQELLIKEQYLQIIYECESKQTLNIETINSMLDELYAPSVSSNVKLMTIHQAKGLEFDTVIIPGLGRRPQNDKPPIIHIKEFADNSLLLAPTKSYTEMDDSNTYSYLKYIDSQQDKFEIMRLLYVAMTRAKSNICLLGCANKNNSASVKTFLWLLVPFYRNRLEDLDSAVEDTEYKKQEAPKLLRYSPFKIPNKTLEINYEEIDYQLSLDRLFKSLLGTLIHQYFEFGLFDPNEGNIKLELKRTGISPNKINESVKFILKMLNNTKQDPIFSWLFKERESTLVEAEFIGEESIVVIDRLFIDDDILWIIDFKTSQPSDNEPLSSFVLRQQKEHNKQLLLYKEILASIYNNEIKCAIYCPSVQNLIEVH